MSKTGVASGGSPGTHECSDATLEAVYGFTITDELGGALVSGAALTTFDGKGGLVQKDFTMHAGAGETEFETGETGTIRFSQVGSTALYRHSAK